MDEARERTAAFALAATHAWVERAVIGLGLCPYARGAQALGRVRTVCSAARDEEALLADLAAEIEHVLGSSVQAVETTLLVLPWVLRDFPAYNDFLALADATLDALGATGTLQIASFHPDYRFAGTAPDDISNATNRSPYPILQLLREASVSAAVEGGADGEAIAAANIETLRRLGRSRWERLAAACAADARRAVGAPGDSRALSATPGSLPLRRPKALR